MMAVYLNFHPSSSLWVLYIVKLQLILKTKTTYPLALHYLILRGPFGDMKVDAKIHKFEFTDQENESPYVHLPLADTAECNRLLAAKVINFRYVDCQLYFGAALIIYPLLQLVVSFHVSERFTVCINLQSFTLKQYFSHFCYNMTHLIT
jgi:hypothetical protein